MLAQIVEIKRLTSSAVTPLYRRATDEGIQLFLAGSAGLLQTTEDVRFEPCPGLMAVGRGVVSPENIAFTVRYGVKWPVGYEVNISSQGENFIQVDFDTPWYQPESDVIAELSRRFSCTLDHWR
ncbi:DUF1281 domain-containing protein [Escherichia coli]|nr:DUF1281 domain-containing protein [Escherichia coli]EHS3657097.1 DUF1281 domain-containing protein [Escherichia coli]MBB7314689.1 DUF1281 domain-containing protein [Escherichia coli]HBA7686599.1 DUF1281 domain-containing protein [Escherichia coli]HBA7856555.1 DUF1281 domain-containing protein [Escherichia coli]